VDHNSQWRLKSHNIFSRANCHPVWLISRKASTSPRRPSSAAILARANAEGWDEDKRSHLLGPTEAVLARSRILDDERYRRSCRRARLATHVAETFEASEGRVRGPWGRELRPRSARRSKVA